MIASRKTYGRADVSHEDLVSSQRRVTNGLSYAQWGRDIASRWTDPRLSELTRVSHVRHGVGGGFPTTDEERSYAAAPTARSPRASRRAASRARGTHTHRRADQVARHVEQRAERAGAEAGRELRDLCAVGAVVGPRARRREKEMCV